jgi:signal transduction histidine kinase
MRRLLGVLREDTERDGVDRRPQPGLRELNDLIDDARDATATGVRLIMSGAPTALDPGVELVAYRIVQEALTNARRHAPGPPSTSSCTTRRPRCGCPSGTAARARRWTARDTG